MEDKQPLTEADKDKLFAEVSDAILQKADKVIIRPLPKNRLEKWLHGTKISDRNLKRLGVTPRRIDRKVEPVSLGNLIRISEILLSVEITRMPDGTRESYELIAKHGRTMAEVIAIAMRNKITPPTAKEIQFVVDNFSANEMMFVFILVLKKMNIANFTTSIASIVGINILKETKPVSAKNAEKSEEANPTTQGS